MQKYAFRLKVDFMLSKLSSWFGSIIRTKAMVTEEIKLPPDLPNWPVVKELLTDLKDLLMGEGITDQETGWFLQTVYNTIQSDHPLGGSIASQVSRLKAQAHANVKKKLDQNCLWFGMLKYLRKISKAERETFLFTTLPKIIELALTIEECRPPQSLQLSRQQHGGSTVLSRQFVCSVVACFFLCLFPERKREETTNMNIINFTNFFKHLPIPTQIAKLRCILHYFECIIERGMQIQGNIVFSRKVATDHLLLNFEELVQCDVKLCPVKVFTEGHIEESDADTLRVTFGNRSLGGGVLGRARVQEEIHFCICPELLAAMLFMENMAPNEAIFVSGFEQFSCYMGYADSFEFAGHYEGEGQAHSMVTIDAVSYRNHPLARQYEEQSLLRDLNKAVIGFSRLPGIVDTELSPWQQLAGGDGSGAVDIAADMVTSVMSDALRQAAASPTSSEPPSLHHPHPHGLESQLQPHLQSFPMSHLHHGQHHPNDTHVKYPLLPDQPSPSSSAEFGPSKFCGSSSPTVELHDTSAICRQQSAASAAPSSRTLHNETAQSSLHTHPLTTSPSSSSNVNVSVDSFLTLQPSLWAHSTSISTTAATTTAIIAPNITAQSLHHGSQSSAQSYQRVAPSPAATHSQAQREMAALSLVSQPTTAVDTSVSPSQADASQTGATGFSQPSALSALTSDLDFPVAYTTESPTSVVRQFTSDLLGNLRKIPSIYEWKEHPSRQIDTEVDEGKREFHPLSQGKTSELSRRRNQEDTLPPDSSTGPVIEISETREDGAASNLFTLTDIDIKPTAGTSESKTREKCLGLLESVDVVLSLPALQSGLERVGSGLSNLSMAVNVDSQSVSTNSAEEENNKKQLNEVLYVSVEDNGQLMASQGQMSEDAQATSLDSMLLEPRFSMSPHSSLSSANVSPNTSFVLPEPPNGSSDVHVTADFFIPGLEQTSGHTRTTQRRGSRDFHSELRDFLSSSSSGSRGSGSGGAPLSSTSSGGSRSGSISSHGTNGSTNDFAEFWTHMRRRSSQMSDTTSRRSSSSKHSSDFSTDLEEISEGLGKHSHGVIEEESSLLAVVTDFASHFVTAAVRNGLAAGAHLSVMEKAEAEKEERKTDELSVTKSEFDVAKQEGHEGANGQSTSENVPLRKGRPFSRVGTLVRQEEVNLDQEDFLSSHSCETAYSSQTEQQGLEKDSTFEQTRVEPMPEALFAVSESVSTTSKPESAKSLVTSALPRPSSSKFGVSVLSPHTGLLTAAETSQSVDSGFISTRSSVTSTTEDKVEVPCVPSGGAAPTSEMLEKDSSFRKTEFSAFSVPFSHSTEEQGVSKKQPSFPKMYEMKTNISPPLIAGRKVPVLKAQADNRPQYVTLESKTVYLPPENLQWTEKTSREDTVASKIHEVASADIPKPVSTTCADSSESSKAQADTRSKRPHEKQRALRQSQIPKIDSVVKHEGDISRKAGETVPIFSKMEEGGAAAIETPSETPSVQPCSEASRPSKSSGIPRPVETSKTPGHVKSSRSSMYRSKSSPVGNDSPAKKDKSRGARNKQHSETSSSVPKSARRIEPLFRPHKSRYLISDIAPPLFDKKKKAKDAPQAAPDKKHRRSSSKKHEERRRKEKGETLKHEPKHFTETPKFIRFVNSLAEMSLSQAVLEGAEIISKIPAARVDISDEIYNWFAGKIVNEVLLHVVNEIELPEDQVAEVSSGQPQPLEVGASQDTSPLSLSQSTDASAAAAAAQHPCLSELELLTSKTEPKPKSILPAKSDTTPTDSKKTGQLRSSGSFKVVKFKEGSQEEKVSPSSLSLQTFVTPPSPSKTNATPTFQRPSSSGVSIPIRRRGSLDLPSSSPPGAWGATSLSSSYLSKSSSTKSPSSQPKSQASESGQARLTSVDLSLDIYQAAAAIVNQVFQAVSDSMDIQPLSPVSSGRHGTMSSTDTAIHSTGSRLNSHYGSIASNIFSSTSAKTSDSPRRSRRSVSPSIGIFSRKPMSRETLTNAFLKVEGMGSFKTYERRSSEPCSTSVQLSLQAFNSIKFNNKTVEDKQRKISRTDDDIGRGHVWRRGSLDSFSFERRNSCGFKDPVLSRFAEELMKADTSVPELVIVGSRASSSSASSRRSSVSAFRDNTLANLDSELLNTSFTSGCSMPVSHSPRSQYRRSDLDRSRSRESRNWKSDSSDTEYWFPPPRFVGEEFQQEYNRQHSQEELQDYASFFAGRVMQEAVCVIKCDPEYMSREEQDMDMFAENLSDQIMRDAFLTMAHWDYRSGVGGGADQRTHSSLSTEMTGDEVYYDSGAKPKQISASSARPQSQPRKIPRRREVRSRDGGGDYSRKPESVSNTVIQQPVVTTESFYSAATPDPFLLPSSQSSSVEWGGARPKQGHRYFHKSSADSKQSPSKLKRHSSPASIPPSSSSSLKPPSTSLQVPPRRSYTESQRALRARSKSASASIGASNISVYKGSPVSEIPRQVKMSRDRREVSHARRSSISSNSSYHSEQTGSSVLSSSSESIGPTGKDVTYSSRTSGWEIDYRDVSSQLSPVDQTQLSHHEYSLSQEGFRKEKSYGKKKWRRDVAARRKCDRIAQTHEWVEMYEMPGRGMSLIDTYASTLSSSIMVGVLDHCRDNKWLKYQSHHRAIATGNWGCGAYRGNAQLKLVIQWIAASIAQAPQLMYYTFGNPRVEQAQMVIDLISGWTVGHLALALREYCSWVCLNVSASSSSTASTRSSPQREQHTQSFYAWQEEEEAQLPQSFFDFLLDKYHSEEEGR